MIVKKRMITSGICGNIASFINNNNSNNAKSRIAAVAAIVGATIVLVGIAMTQFGTTGEQRRNGSLDNNNNQLNLLTTTSTTTTETSTATQQQPSTRKRRASLNKKHVPFTCPDLFAMDATDKVIVTESGTVLSVRDPNEGILHARRTIRKPFFWISLHQEKFDSTRWPVMADGYYYEFKQTEAFVQILQQQQQQGGNDPPLHVLDVGGNIGWYSLLSVAAALEVGRSVVVDVFEPNPRNRYRICESIQMNHWNDNPKVQFNIYPYGVSSASSRNSSDVIMMSIADSGLGRLGRLSDVDQAENIPVRLVSLDDITPQLGWEQEQGLGSSTSPISILKVDVEGLEWQVFQGTQRLLQSGRVENVFFEGNIRSEEETADFRSIVRLLVQSGFRAHMRGGWPGPTEPVRTPPIPKLSLTPASKASDDNLIANYTAGLYDECFINRYIDPQDPAKTTPPVDQCNLWWKKASTTTS